MLQIQSLYTPENSWRHPDTLPQPTFLKNCSIITGESSHILYQKTKKIIDSYHLDPASVTGTFSIDNCLRMVELYTIIFSKSEAGCLQSGQIKSPGSSSPS